MSSTNRKTKRAALFALLNALLSHPQLILNAVPESFEGQQPIVYLKSRGSAEIPVSFGAGNGTSAVSEALYFEIHSLVLYKDKRGDPELTVAGSEDLLDDVDKEIRDVLGDNLNTADWQVLVQEGASQILPNVEIEGATMRHELRVVRIMP